MFYKDAQEERHIEMHAGIAGTNLVAFSQLILWEVNIKYFIAFGSSFDAWPFGDGYVAA
jgi:hypothetical protein